LVFSKNTNIGEILDNPKAREALLAAVPVPVITAFWSTVRHLTISFIEYSCPGKLRDYELAAIEKAFENLGDV